MYLKWKRRTGEYVPCDRDVDDAKMNETVVGNSLFVLRNRPSIYLLSAKWTRTCSSSSTS